MIERLKMQLLSGEHVADKSADGAAVPDALIAQIKNAPNRAIFNVSANETFSGNILKCDTIAFSARGTLTLNDWDPRKHPFLAIVARRWIFLAAQDRSVIRRPPALVATAGDVGEEGRKGQNGRGDGAAGGPGEPGGAGQPGETLDLPPLFLFGENVLDQPGNPLPYMHFAVEAAGIVGGDGGLGGRGGQGGNGATGHRASDGPAWCRRSGGRGGSGGIGGAGGTGGAAGRGGNGADVFYVGPKDFVGAMIFTNVVNVGGDAGSPGNGGLPGSGGAGGAGGRDSTYCSGGSNGSTGASGVYGAAGAVSFSGSKGIADVALRENLDDLF